MILSLSIFLLFTSTSLFFSIKKNLEMMDKIETVSLTVYECLDVLEDQHRSIEGKTKLEVFSDDPIIKSLVEDMKIAKISVARVANVLDDTISSIEE